MVEYENLPAIVTMDEAIANDSFYSLRGEDNITRGDPAKVLMTSSVDQVVEGEVRIGGQEHFYLEANATLVTRLNKMFSLILILKHSRKTYIFKTRINCEISIITF